MAFTEFYLDYANGNNLNAGDNTANGLVTVTSGTLSGHTYTASSGTPFSGVSVGDFASLYNNFSSTATCIGRVTAVGGSGASITISSTFKAGGLPSDEDPIYCRTGGAWKQPSTLNMANLSTLKNIAGDIPRFNLKNNATYVTTSTAITLGSVGPYIIEGYTSAPGDGGSFIVQGGTINASYALVTINTSSTHIKNGIFYNNGSTGSANGINITGHGNVLTNCVVHDVKGAGINLYENCLAIECETYACNTSDTSGLAGMINTSVEEGSTSFIRCISHDNSGSNSHGFKLSYAGTLINCISDSNGAAGFHVGGTCHTANFMNCVAHGNTTDGLVLAASVLCSSIIENCIFTSNGGYGINGSGSQPKSGIVRSCAYHSNTSGRTTGLGGILDSAEVILSGSPFVAGSTGNFTLNSTSGAGASCKSLGRGSFSQTQSGYTGIASVPSIGAVEPASASSSSGGSFTYIG